jgi:hypothetical protein
VTALHRVISRPVSAVEYEPDLYRVEWADSLRCPPTTVMRHELDRLLRRFDSFRTPVTVIHLEDQ